MFGIGEMAYALIRRHLGLRGDAAAAGGSLHAKVAEELARIGAINPASGGTDTLFKFLKKVNDDSKLKLSPGIAYAFINSTSLSNVVSISGAGYLVGISQIVYHASAGAGYYEITLDGTVIYSDSNMFSRTMISTYGQQLGSLSLPLFHRFNTSLLVRAKVATNSSVNCNAAYILD